MNARRMSLGKVRALVVVALLGALGFSSDDNTSAQQAVDAIELEREWTQKTSELWRAERSLGREESSWVYSAELARQSARHTLSQLMVYHDRWVMRRAVTQRRLGALDRFARGGAARLLFGGLQAGQSLWLTVLDDSQGRAPQDRKVAQVRLLWWISRLFEKDLQEISTYAKANEESWHSMLQAVREIEAQKHARVFRALEQLSVKTTREVFDHERLRVQERRISALSGAGKHEPAVSAALHGLYRVRADMRRAQRDSGFALNRRSLVRPVEGPVIGKFGRYRDAQTRVELTRNGLELAAKPGSEVRACAQGIVLAVREVPLYGQAVVIDHGEQFLTLTARLEHVDVVEGEPVDAGQPIGKASAHGDISSVVAPVYFELRHGDLAIDPLRFLEAFDRADSP